MSPSEPWGSPCCSRSSPAPSTRCCWSGPSTWPGSDSPCCNAASLAAPPAAETSAARSSWATFRRAALTNLLNPKAYLFMLAIFPQFIHPERGPIWAQAVVLGIIITVTQLGVYGVLALAAGSARGWLASRPVTAVAVGRAVGTVLIAAAVLTAVEGWRAL